MTSIYSPKLFSKLSSEWYLATSLYDAIDDGNLRQVAILLQEKHADPNIVIPDYDITPFHLAVGHENEQFAKDVTKLLLKNGADPNVKDNDGVTPLHVAAVWNRSVIVRLLLNYGGDPMIVDDSERNAFHYAYEEHAWETLKTLEIYRRAVIKKNESNSENEKNYNIQLEKVVVESNGIQAEYRALCHGCKQNIVETRSVGTQTSLPTIRMPIFNNDLESFLEIENTNFNIYAANDWCREAESHSIVITEDCQRKITSHRTKSKIYEYNPLFDNSSKLSLPKESKMYESCGNLENSCLEDDVMKELMNKISPKSENSQDNSNETKDTDLKSGENFSEDSLISDAKKNSNIPFIDESESSQNCDRNKSEKLSVELEQEPEPEKTDIEQKENKHVSWSGCLSTCACIPKRFNDSDSSVYYTNPESDADDKGVKEMSNSNVEEQAQEKSSFMNVSLPKSSLNISVEYKYTDDEDGIEFVEAKMPLCLGSIHNSKENTPVTEKRRIASSREDLDTSDGTSYDTDYIRSELKKLGFVSGPMAGNTKKLYLRKLRRIRRGEFSSRNRYKPGFSSELEQVLLIDDDNWEKTLIQWSSLEAEILDHFADCSFSSSWRNGTAKTSFTYLLLDPRVSKNLPARCEQMDLIDVWRDFVNAIFYVGKGTRARQYEHLHEALLVWKETKAYPRKRCNLKVRHILEIWKEGLGVVCVQVFHNIMSAEAFTREAAMIDAIGLTRLKNEKAGIYYGKVTSWNPKLKRRLGAYLLYRAMRIFIANNEVQLKPTDIC